MMNTTLMEPRQAKPVQAVRQHVDIDALIGQLEEEQAARERLASLLVKESQPAAPLRMTYPEFLAWADEDTLAEWVNGEVIMASPASLPHQQLAGFLGDVLHNFVTLREMGIIIRAPFQMKLEHGREPDILFISNRQRQRLKETYLDGTADIVVEVISPESIGRDRGEKFYEYEAGGVAEYWLLDPLTQRAEFYQLDAGTGRYRLAPFEAGSIYRSAALPGLWLRVDWLWEHPLPHPLHVLGTIAGVAPHEIEHFMNLLR